MARIAATSPLRRRRRFGVKVRGRTTLVGVGCIDGPLVVVGGTDGPPVVVGGTDGPLVVVGSIDGLCGGASGWRRAEPSSVTAQGSPNPAAPKPALLSP